MRVAVALDLGIVHAPRRDRHLFTCLHEEAIDTPEGVGIQPSRKKHSASGCAACPASAALGLVPKKSRRSAALFWLVSVPYDGEESFL